MNIGWFWRLGSSVFVFNPKREGFDRLYVPTRLEMKKDRGKGRVLELETL